MDHYIDIILIAGIASLGMAFMPTVTKATGISYALIYVCLGALIYLLFPHLLPSPMPERNSRLTLGISELIVIISLMGTGIKVDRRFSISNWSSPLRLVFFAMLLCIATSATLGSIFLDLALPSALLLAAVLAPTDPVLASDVQVGPPNESKKSETKFALTSEAGLNDGLAFPFTWLAILVAGSSVQPSVFFNWLGYHVFYKIATGLIIGWLCGRSAGYLVFNIAKKYRLLQPKDGFFAVALMLCTYGITEILYGYGFISVFICALTLRHKEKDSAYHRELHSFTDQIERLLLGIILIFFGGALVSGILSPLTWQIALFSVSFLICIRPLSAYISLFGIKVHWKERLAICFFGIRGIGSIYYLAFAMDHASFPHHQELWAAVSFTLLLSIVLHGLTATSVMNHMKKHLADEKLTE